VRPSRGNQEEKWAWKRAWVKCSYKMDCPDGSLSVILRMKISSCTSMRIRSSPATRAEELGCLHVRPCSGRPGETGGYCKSSLRLALRSGVSIPRNRCTDATGSFNPCIHYEESGFLSRRQTDTSRSRLPSGPSIHSPPHTGMRIDGTATCATAS